MSIDQVTLARELNHLRELAQKKWEEDPLPTGRDAEVRLKKEIQALALESHITDFETDGYTVLPPGTAAPIELFDEIASVMEGLAKRLKTDNPAVSGLGETLYHMLPEHPAFERALMARAPLTLVTYLLGYRAKLSQCTGLIKDSNVPALGIHADHSAKCPAPWSPISNYSVVTWVLTDYTRENGAVCVWPGSHLRGQPVPENLVMAHDHPEMRVLEIPRGSVIIWHGSLWHGALPRTASGRRMTLVLPHVRDSVQPQELFWSSVTEEMISRNPPRFCTLMGLTSGPPWFQDGPDREQFVMSPYGGSKFE